MNKQGQVIQGICVRMMERIARTTTVAAMALAGYSISGSSSLSLLANRGARVGLGERLGLVLSGPTAWGQPWDADTKGRGTLSEDAG